MTLPPWMLTPPTVDIAHATPPPRSHGLRAVRRAMGALLGLIEALMTNEAIAARRGLLQRIDPRAKVIGFIGLIVVATLVHALPALLVCGAFALLLAWLSRIPAQRIGRTWVMIPLFSVAITLPALLNVVTPGASLVTLWRPAFSQFGPWAMPEAFTITDAGVAVAVRFVVRVTLCVTLAMLLTATTPANALFRGLRALGVPQLFVTLLGMMTRYLSVLARVAEEIHLAKLSRSITAGTVRQEQAWVASGMGALFRRTHALGHAVYLAMLSRGYTGEVRTLRAPRWLATDWAFLILVGGVGAIMVLLG